MTITTRNIPQTSAEARAQGFTTLEWFRAFTFAQHMERIRAEQTARLQERKREGWGH